jgi:hypothetical protein
MPIIHLIGPNAIGKTTAVRRWAARYGHLLATVSLDLLRKPGYDTAEEKSARCAEWRDAPIVTVVESARTTQLMVVSCDMGSSGHTFVAGQEVASVTNWKGTQDQKQQGVAQVRQRLGITVLESVRTTTTTTTTRYALPEDPVILLTCDWQTLGNHLRARCEVKGKRFRDDYWDQWKLGYEASKRYLNFAAKNLTPEQVKHFEINDQARDWPAVDDYFGALFRRLHNALIRSQ